MTMMHDANIHNEPFFVSVSVHMQRMRTYVIFLIMIIAIVIQFLRKISNEIN